MEKVQVVRIEHGLKVWCNKETYNAITTNKGIMSKFRLNVREYADGYTVYFKGDNPTEFGTIYFDSVGKRTWAMDMNGDLY